ncbi:MAG: hypothetical protein M1833_002982 [Piccolia ochrophora]|nr:MAG: hypothetical protein M1833_002982 [Piccolia ochrophora]
MSTSSIPITFLSNRDEMSRPRSGQGFNNPVPPPPGYRSVIDPAENMVHLIMGVHHHIDSQLGAMSQSIAAKHDNIIDHIIRKHDHAMEIGNTWSKDNSTRIDAIEKSVDEILSSVLRLASKVDSLTGVDKTEQLINQNHAAAMAAIDKVMVQVQELGSKVDNIAIRLDALEARSNESRCSSTPLFPGMMYDLGSRNAFASVPTNIQSTSTPDVRDHPAFSTQHNSFPNGDDDIAPWYRLAQHNHQQSQGQGH